MENKCKNKNYYQKNPKWLAHLDLTPTPPKNVFETCRRKRADVKVTHFRHGHEDNCTTKKPTRGQSLGNRQTEQESYIQREEPRDLNRCDQGIYFIVWSGISSALTTVCFLFFPLVCGNYHWQFSFSATILPTVWWADVFSLNGSPGHWDPTWTWWRTVHQPETQKCMLY